MHSKENTTVPANTIQLGPRGEIRVACFNDKASDDARCEGPASQLNAVANLIACHKPESGISCSVVTFLRPQTSQADDRVSQPRIRRDRDMRDAWELPWAEPLPEVS